MSVFSLPEAVLSNEHSIRLLSLEPGESDDPLIGSLTSVDVDEAGAYEPLSYVWSDPTRTHNIVCQGLEIRLTGSLYHALCRVRLPNARRRIWADQICIDQDNIVERSQQVQFMNTIYRRANRVLVWLGNDEKGEASAAFDLVQQLADTFRDDVKHAKFYNDHVENLRERSGEEWEPVKHLTRLPWFTRTWIIQEIGTKASAVLLWGAAEIDWQTVYAACENLTAYHHLRKKFDIKTSEIKYIFQRFVEPEKSSRHANRFNFMYELHRARHLKVTDAKDRVFAFLGHYSVRHGSNEALRLLEADYTKTIEEVYTDAATRALQDDSEPLAALAAVQHMSLPSKFIEHQQSNRSACQLPSWVPDWRIYQSYILSEPTSPHCASGTRKARLSVSMDTRVLEIAGIEIDTVAACSEQLKETTFHMREGSKTAETTIKRLWREVCGKSDSINLEERYLNGDSAASAFMQTLSNGCIAIWWQEHNKLPENERRSYHQIPKSEWLAYGAALLSWAVGQPLLADPDNGAMKARDPHSWTRAANGASTNRIFGRTGKGYYVLGPGVMEEGDKICLLFGGKMPFCLRPWFGKHLLVGECYIHGLMAGESMEMAKLGKVTEEVFQIV